MATTDTGPLGTLTFISAEPVDPDGTGENWLRVRYSLDTTSATEALTGFWIWHDDEAGSTTPVWVNAADAVLAGGGDGGTPTVYEVLVSVPLSGGVVTWWETFEEYALGSISAASMDKGGSGWNGAWASDGSGGAAANLVIADQTINLETGRQCNIISTVLGRTLSIGTNWTKVVVGVRWTCPSTTTWGTAAVVRLGMSAGTAQMPITGTSASHFAGVTNRAVPTTDPRTTWSTARVELIQGGTSSYANRGYFVVGRTGNTRSAMLVEIEKSGTSVKVRPVYSTAYQPSIQDVTDAKWKSIMGGDYSLGTNGIDASTGQRTFSGFDEATNGYLDSACVSWDLASQVEVLDFQVRKIS